MEDKHSGHGKSGDAKSHPSLRKLDPQAVEVAKGMFAEGKGPKEVLEELKGWNGSVTAQDVYNLKAKIARKASGGGSSRKVKGTAAGEANGAQTNGQDGMEAVDPALQAEDSGLTGGGRAPAARMQDVDMQDPTDATAGGAMNGEAPGQKTCECNCCEH